MELTLECQKRPEGSKPKALRRSGLIPAVLYGHNGTESVPLTVAEKKVERLLKDASVNNTLIQLNIPELSWNGKTLLREVQVHPWKGYPYHLSFFSVSDHGVIEVEVPLNFVGEATGVKIEGGILDPVLTELQVRCKPDSIPESIDVDVSNLHVGDSIPVKNLALPEGIVTTGESERIVVSVIQAATETEPIQGEESAQA